MRPPALLFGIPIDDLTMGSALDRIGRLVEVGRRERRSHQVVTVNVDFLVNALTDPGVRRVLEGADLNLADGMPVVWAARAAGMAQRERVAGSDLVPRLAAVAAERGWRLHLFGAGEGVATRAAELLRELHPELRIATSTAPVGEDGSVADDVVDRIADGAPDVLCVALGNPKQEHFIAAHRRRLGVPVSIGVGGSLDMLVGDRRRAPEWARRVGLEWVVRAAQEPGRLGRRYAGDAAVFGPRAAAHVRHLRRTLGGPGLAVAVDRTVTLTPAPAVASPGDWEQAALAAAEGSRVDVRLDGLDALDIRALAQLVGLVRIARTFGGAGGVVRVAGAGPRLSSRMAAVHCGSWVRDAPTM